MKKNLIIGLLCAVSLAGLFTITKAPAQGNSHQSDPEVVVMRITENVNTNYAPKGMYAYVSSSSAGAPQFEGGPRMQLAQILADLLKLGYEIHQVDSITVMAVKR